MKKIALSVVAMVAMSRLVVAGGDFETVEPVVAVPMVEEADSSNFYLGLGLSAISARDSATSMNFFNETNNQDRLGNFTFLAGYNVNPYIALEGRYTLTFTQEDFVNKCNGWSLFVKPQYPVTESWSIYGLLGYGGVTMDAVNYAFRPVDVDGSGFQWGLGASYDVTDAFEVFIDYTSLASDMSGTFATTTGPNQYFTIVDKADADAITIGVNYKF